MERYDDGGWPAYVPVAERRRRAEREAAKLLKKGYAAAPVRIEGRAIAITAWGRAWCDNLERYRDYESRLPRGRAYVRNGSVLDLQIGPGEVRALVSGSSIYQVAIAIAPAPDAQWRCLCADCAGQIDSMVELLQGRLSSSVMDRMCRRGAGLFPSPSEITFSCSCPDQASMCKHVAAALYGVGARLDQSPELLFKVRAVDERDLLASVDAAPALAKPASQRVLQGEDMSALFGIEMAGSDAGAESRPSRSLPGPKRSAAAACRGAHREKADARSPRQDAPAAATAANKAASLPGRARYASMASRTKPPPISRKPATRAKAQGKGAATGPVSGETASAPARTPASPGRSGRAGANVGPDLGAILKRLDAIAEALAELQALPAALRALDAQVGSLVASQSRDAAPPHAATLAKPGSAPARANRRSPAREAATGPRTAPREDEAGGERQFGRARDPGDAVPPGVAAQSPGALREEDETALSGLAKLARRGRRR